MFLRARDLDMNGQPATIRAAIGCRDAGYMPDTTPPRCVTTGATGTAMTGAATNGAGMRTASMNTANTATGTATGIATTITGAGK